MREYETTIIIQPEISDEGVAEFCTKLDGVVEGADGVRLMYDDQGRRRLAYEIENFQKGRYVMLHFLDEGGVIPALERVLRLDDSVLRFLTVQVEEEVADIEGRKAEAAEEVRVRDQRAAERAAREAEEATARAEREAEAAVAAEAAAAAKAVEAAKAEKVAKAAEVAKAEEAANAAEAAGTAGDEAAAGDEATAADETTADDSAATADAGAPEGAADEKES